MGWNLELIRQKQTKAATMNVLRWPELSRLWNIRVVGVLAYSALTALGDVDMKQRC